MPKFIRRGFWICTGLAVAGVLFVFLANCWVLHRAKPRLVERAADLPPHQLGIVLGTSPFLRGGQRNPFFENRMDAAAELYRRGKVKHLLLTGDNSTREYDEVTAMRAALAKRGVPESATTLDYAGLRTLDSMARARRIFSVYRAIIITDDFHLARAVFLAQVYGIQATGFASEPVRWNWSKKTRTREIAARVAMCLDVYLFRTKPKYAGEKVRLPVRTN